MVGVFRSISVLPGLLQINDCTYILCTRIPTIYLFTYVNRRTSQQKSANAMKNSSPSLWQSILAGEAAGGFESPLTLSPRLNTGAVLIFLVPYRIPGKPGSNYKLQQLEYEFRHGGCLPPRFGSMACHTCTPVARHSASPTQANPESSSSHSRQHAN